MFAAYGQPRLFETENPFPSGFAYRPDFLTPEEENELMGYCEDLPLFHPVQEGYEAKRRIMNFGWSYDFAKAKLVKGPALPPFLQPLARKVAKWLDIPKGRVVEALITEYPPGASIGWHRDNETFESIIGISLSGWCRMRLRPRRSRFIRRTIRDVVSVPLAPRSAYLMQEKSRWDFQHSIAPVETFRYSITFRTLPKGYALR
jgi:alkylated DNA repair dioxygenase AlkB